MTLIIDGNTYLGKAAITIICLQLQGFLTSLASGMTEFGHKSCL